MKKKKKNKPASQEPILAAGGIVTRGRVRPLFAVVRLRRQKSWVLPKGKLNRNETVLQAARREAIEETGHDVAVHEFLGSIAYKTALRPKIVRFFRMEASGRPVAKLMKDVSAVRWLPLSRALAKLTHEREKEFLAKAGPETLRSLGRKRPTTRPVSRLQRPRGAAKKAAAPVRRKTSKAAPGLKRTPPKSNGRLPPRATAAATRITHVSDAKTRSIHPAQRLNPQTLWRWLGR